MANTDQTTTSTNESETKLKIPFRVYKRPNGRRVEEMFTCGSKETYDSAMAVLKEGYFFEAEVLMTGQVSVTCFDPEEETDVAIEICSNGPAVVEAIDKLVASAFKIAFP